MISYKFRYLKHIFHVFVMMELVATQNVVTLQNVVITIDVNAVARQNVVITTFCNVTTFWVATVQKVNRDTIATSYYRGIVSLT